MKKIVGFSLLELIITFVIIALLISLIFPSYRYFIHSKKVNMTIDQVIQGIRYARSCAIHQSQRVAFCGSDNAETCSGQWDKGQIVMSAIKGNVLRHFSPISTSLHLTWQSSFGKDKALWFNALGFTDGQQGHFALYRKADNHLLAKIIILGTGRIRVEKFSMLKFSRFSEEE